MKKGELLQSRNLEKTKPLRGCTLLQLCAEDKAKIGELVKTLEARRAKIEELEAQVACLKDHLHNQQTVSAERTHVIETLTLQLTHSQQTLQNYAQTTRQHQTEVDELKRERMRHIKQFNQMQMKEMKEMKEYGCSVDRSEVEKREEGTQTKQKRKERGIQTEDMEETPMYRPHSESFQRIMKGQLKLNQLYEDEQGNMQEQYHNYIEKDRSKEIKRDKKERNKEDSQERKKEKSRRKQIESDESSGDIEQLTKRLLQEKERHMQALRKQYNYNIIERPMERSMERPMERSMERPMERSMERPSRLVTGSDKLSPFKDDKVHIDDEQLNRLLKSKHFSASHVLSNSRGKERGKEKEERGKEKEERGKERKEERKEEAYKAYKVHAWQDYVRDKNQASMADMNFYGSQLLDLVDSLREP